MDLPKRPNGKIN